jgi:hypothetical protein
MMWAWGGEEIQERGPAGKTGLPGWWLSDHARGKNQNGWEMSQISTRFNVPFDASVDQPGKMPVPAHVSHYDGGFLRHLIAIRPLHRRVERPLCARRLARPPLFSICDFVNAVDQPSARNVELGKLQK